MRPKIFFLTTGIVLFSACSLPTSEPKPAKVFEQGHVNGHVYTNDYFGLTLDFPADWSRQSTEQTNTSSTRAPTR